MLTNNGAFSFLRKHFRPKVYNRTTDFTYEGQRLLAALCLIHGEIKFFKKGRLVKTLSQPDIVGLDYLMEDKEFPYHLKIEAKSEVILVTKKELKDLILYASKTQKGV